MLNEQIESEKHQLLAKLANLEIEAEALTAEANKRRRTEENPPNRDSLDRLLNRRPNRIPIEPEVEQVRPVVLDPKICLD